MSFMCLICDKQFFNARGLVSHIRQIHKLTSNQYYDKYLKKEDDGICKCCGDITYYDDITAGYRTFCSLKCSAISDQVRLGYKNTCMNRFGDVTPMRNNTIKLKLQKTFQENWGCDNPNQSEIIKEKKRKTFQENWGCDNPNQSEIIKEKKRNTCFARFGGPNPSSSLIVNKKQRVSAIKRVERQNLNGEPLMPNIGEMERDCLNELENNIGIKLIRNSHEFAYNIGRFPDGHIPELKLDIQFNELHHYKDKECTIENENTIQTTLDLASVGHIVFNISYYDWVNKKNSVIINLKKLIDILLIGIN